MPWRQAPFGAYRRAVRIEAREGLATAEMEDDVHHFRAMLTHSNGVVVKAEGEAVRTPWTICAGSLGVLRTLEGLSLEAVRKLPAASRNQHCLHLFDVALLAAARAEDAPFLRLYQIEADYDADTPALTLWRDGEAILSWRIEGDRNNGRIKGSAFDGLTLSELPRRLASLPRDEAEAVMILRRGSHISGVRKLDLDAFVGSNALRATPDGSCYAKQPQRSAQAKRIVGSSRDFWSKGDWPLQGQTPQHSPANPGED
jgi:hypothetical protein